MKRYIAEGLTEYLNETHSVWHMPGHKRKILDFSDALENPAQAFCCEKYDIKKLDMTLDMLHKMDVTEVPGLDDLHNPMGMILKSEKELARVYDTLASYYLVNGTTGGIFAAVSACVSNGDKIIVASNCHKSVHNIIDLLKLKVVYVKPDCNGAITPESVEIVCKNNPDAKAAVITSPTYEGVLSEIAKISEIIHGAGMKLIVDEAHGAHLPFINSLKKYSAIYNNADVVIQSLHKTLPSMTQTAIIHVMDEGINLNIKKYLAVFMSSSPSYIMLCDMERAIDIALNKDYEAYLMMLYDIRDKMKELKNLTLLDNSKFFDKKNTEIDPTRLVLFAKEPITGAGFEKLLSDEFSVICEMSGINYVVLISTLFDTKDDFDYLYSSLKKIDDNYDYYIKKIKDIENRTNQVYTFNTNCKDKVYIEKMVNMLNDLEGTAAKDNIYVYPPGIYIVKKGEIMKREIIDELILHVTQGRQLLGDIN
ncbi:MAG: aminotransferase class V-fold PLP-dependent enzyme [Lachnospiraceae bacterium]|nr:aminotransferase class V-fold PLP-dependent enzyme [Lachnospiraceae bacterium]MBQ9233842.1 aminotransferase class V-fold PLP-dependent enzyme [Lachnospiraceae bacterium]